MIASVASFLCDAAARGGARLLLARSTSSVRARFSAMTAMNLQQP
jgi:hypothetical protein